MLAKKLFDVYYNHDIEVCQNLVLKGFIAMTTPIVSNANIQQPVSAPIPDFKPSYNAVQLNLSHPTLNVPPMLPPAPPTATQQWTA